MRGLIFILALLGWISLAILFITILLILLRIETRIDELQIRMDRIERRR